MPKYTPNELLQRDSIIKSHSKLISFLNADIINKLVNLFDENNSIISKYIENERKLQGLNSSNIKVVTMLYDETKENSSLIIKIVKDDVEILHLSIHLVPQRLKPENSGIIHMYKNIYKSRVSSRKRNKLYALIEVKQPLAKPNSLYFSIADGYNTPVNVTNSAKNDPEIQKEMNIIITVLNRLFDEDNNEYYIGNSNKLYNIHKKTNVVLNNMNMHGKLLTRKNKGITMLPKQTSDPIMPITKPVLKANTISRKLNGTRKKLR
jgi:hypothetical protein